MKSKKRFLIALTLIAPLIGWSNSGFAQDSTYFTIKECIEYAMQNNSKIKVAKYDEEFGKKQIAEVKGRAFPQININGNFEDRLKVPLLIIPGFQAPGGGEGIKMGYKYNSSLSGEVTQMIIDPSFGIGLKAAKQSTLLYQQQTVQVSEQTAYNIASAYYQVIVLQEQLKLLKVNFNNTKKILEVTELQYKNGVAKSVDVKRLQVNTNNLESQIRELTLSLDNAFNNLKFQMGMPLEEKIALADTVLVLNENEDIAKEVSVENRIEYQIAKTNLGLQELNTKNNMRSYYPTLTAYGNYGYTGQGESFGLFRTSGNQWVDYTSSSVGLRLRIPVFDGMQKSARIQQSKIRTLQQEENINLLKQSINLEVSNSLAQYKNTRSRIEAEKANVALAQEVYEITQLEFREGVSTSTDLVEAELSLRQAQNMYTRTLLDLYTARLNHEKSLGNLLIYLKLK
ncbi:MAG TPA: TolC family protein [Cytophagaceae bacterium]